MSLNKLDQHELSVARTLNDYEDLTSFRYETVICYLNAYVHSKPRATHPEVRTNTTNAGVGASVGAYCLPVLKKSAASAALLERFRNGAQVGC